MAKEFSLEKDRGQGKILVKTFEVQKKLIYDGLLYSRSY
jgi:hypothetical protein